MISSITKISTIYGNFPVKSLAVNKAIPSFSYDLQTKTIIIIQTSNYKREENQKLIHVVLNEGTSLDCSPNQKLINSEGNPVLPTIGLALVDGRTITEISSLPEEEECYILTAENNLYFANSILLPCTN